MKPYSSTHTHEEESYEGYKERKKKVWTQFMNTILIEINDSSLSAADKRRIRSSLTAMLKEKDKKVSPTNDLA